MDADYTDIDYFLPTRPFVEMIDDTHDTTKSDSVGIPTGALTVLVIAAVAITSVVITLFCMLVNNRRTRRTAQRIQSVVTSPTTSLSRPTRLTTADGVTMQLPPVYTPTDDTQGPKDFDAPPSYEEAVTSPVYAPGSAPSSPTQLGSPSTPDSSEAAVIAVTTIDETATRSNRE